MLRIQKRFNKATLYHLHRGLVSKSSRHNSGDTKKSKTNKTPLWCAPFIFHTKEQDKENKEQDDNAFISSLMSNKAWLTSKMDWLDLPSVEDINAKMTELYPQFTSQFKHLSDGYAKMWDYLTMEDFRKLVEEIKQEEKDPRLYPEMNKDATVR